MKKEKKVNILKDECLHAVLRNEVLRIQISEVLGIEPASVKAVAKRALDTQGRTRIYEYESLELIKDFVKAETVESMYKS